MSGDDKLNGEIAPRKRLDTDRATQMARRLLQRLAIVAADDGYGIVRAQDGAGHFELFRQRQQVASPVAISHGCTIAQY